MVYFKGVGMNSKTIILVLAVLAVIFTAGCTSTTSNPPTPPIANNPGNGNTLPPVATIGPVKEFNMTAKSFEFNPSTVTVNKGDQVVINIHNIDTVAHGFSLATYDIIESINPGQLKTIKFTATQAGEFNFFCSVFCGSGHGDMRGKLIVNP